MDELLSDRELRELDDDALVALVEQRSNLAGDRARETVAILRDEIPADVVV